MHSPAILVIAHDRLITTAYCGPLSAAGFHPRSAHDGTEALAIAQSEPPDLILLDLVLPEPGSTALIELIRATEGLEQVPILLLPTSLHALSRAALQAGASRQLERPAAMESTSPHAELLRAIEDALGIPRPVKTLKFTPPARPTIPPELQKTLCREGLQGAPAALESIRTSLHQIFREPGNSATMGEFLQKTHDFAEQMSLIEERPLFHLASALEMLAFDLVRHPAQLNASINHTLSQAVDLLGTLFSSRGNRRFKDPASSQILIVEDEANTRELLMAAMQLVRIESIGVDAPSTCLQTLSWDRPDLILLDIALPEMDGFALCQQIRSMPDHEHTPIVFITGMASFQNRVQSTLSGGHDFVAKPFHLSELGVKALSWIFKGQLNAQASPMAAAR